MNPAPLPNFLVVGAAKCGSTSLYHYLRQHPDVYMSPLKEPNHFSTDIDPAFFSPEYKLHEKQKNLDIKKYVNSEVLAEEWEAYVHEREDYKKLFRFAGNKKAIGEISNTYLFSKVAAENIHAEFPDMKIVMILRQPAERAYSHYLANLRDGKTILPFREEMLADDAKPIHGWGISHGYYEFGLYYDQVKRYLDIFPRNQVLILFNEDLKSDNQKVMEELFTFIGVKADVMLNYNERYNEAKVPKSARLVKFLTDTGLKRRVFRTLPESVQGKVKEAFFSKDPVPKMSEDDRNWMTSRYREDIRKLETLLGRNLRHWY